MSRYRVEVLPGADKQLAKVKDRVLKARLLRAIYELGRRPTPGWMPEAGRRERSVACPGGRLADRLPDRGRTVGGGRGPGRSEGRGLWVGC